MSSKKTNQPTNTPVGGSPPIWNKLSNTSQQETPQPQNDSGPSRNTRGRKSKKKAPQQPEKAPQQPALPQQSAENQREENNPSQMDIDEPPHSHEEIPLGESTLKDVQVDDEVGLEEEGIQKAEPPPSSADPAQPLSGAPAMSEALNEILTTAPAPKVSSATLLREKVEAARQVAAAKKAEAVSFTKTTRSSRNSLWRAVDMSQNMVQRSTAGTL